MPALLAGRVFTHRVSGPELEHDILVMNSDLKPLDILTERKEHQRLADGSPVVGVLMPFDADTLAARSVPLEVIGDYGAVLLPSGYLQGKGLGEGDVITLGLAEDGLLLESVPAPVVTAETVAKLGQRLSAVLEAKPDEPIPLDDAVWTACADDPTLFTQPLPPLGAALDACGLAHDGEWLAAQGFDFPRWRVEKRCAAIARVHDLSDDEALAVLAMVTLYHQVAELHAAALAVHDDGDEAALAAFTAELTSRPEPSPATRTVLMMKAPRSRQRSVTVLVGPAPQARACPVGVHPGRRCRRQGQQVRPRPAGRVPLGARDRRRHPHRGRDRRARRGQGAADPAARPVGGGGLGAAASRAGVPGMQTHRTHDRGRNPHPGR